MEKWTGRSLHLSSLLECFCFLFLKDIRVDVHKSAYRLKCELDAIPVINISLGLIHLISERASGSSF